MIFWEFYGKKGIRRAFCEANERKICTFIVRIMVITGILSFENRAGSTKNFFKCFSRK
jgi:hypothetical protein